MTWLTPGRGVVLALALAALGGCLAVVTDEGVPAPEVAIAPANPEDDDALRLVLPELPQDALTAWRVRWRLNGDRVCDLDDLMSVDSGLTKPGERWEVGVRLLYRDRASEEGTASAQIGGSGDDDDDTTPPDDDDDTTDDDDDDDTTPPGDDDDDTTPPGDDDDDDDDDYPLPVTLDCGIYPRVDEIEPNAPYQDSDPPYNSDSWGEAQQIYKGTTGVCVRGSVTCATGYDDVDNFIIGWEIDTAVTLQLNWEVSGDFDIHVWQVGSFPDYIVEPIEGTSPPEIGSFAADPGDDSYYGIRVGCWNGEAGQYALFILW